jgi:hypothetical protein
VGGGEKIIRFSTGSLCAPQSSRNYSIMCEFLISVFTFLKEIAPTVSFYSPLIITFITGFWIHRKLEKYKSKLQIDQSIIKYRTDAYFKIRGDLNTIYSYIKRVGNWKELTPKEVIALKRTVDREIFCTKPFWSKELIEQYLKFINICFETNRGHGKDAAIIGNIDKYNDLPNWNNDFDDLFTDGFSEVKLDNSYESLLNTFSKDFGVE